MPCIPLASRPSPTFGCCSCSTTTAATRWSSQRRSLRGSVGRPPAFLAVARRIDPIRSGSRSCRWRGCLPSSPARSPPLGGCDRHLHPGRCCQSTPPAPLARRPPLPPRPLQLESVEGDVLHLRGGDLIDGTPILDVKPYLPYADAPPPAETRCPDYVNPASAGRQPVAALHRTPADPARTPRAPLALLAAPCSPRAARCSHTALSCCVRAPDATRRLTASSPHCLITSPPHHLTASSPHHLTASSPHCLIASSPHRLIAASPGRLVTASVVASTPILERSQASSSA